MAHFFDAVGNGKPVRTTIEDGVKALELADAATTSWRERRRDRSMTLRAVQALMPRAVVRPMACQRRAS